MKNEESTPPIEEDSLAEAIRRISHGMEALFASGLNKQAIVVLIHDATTGVGKRQIIAVLDSLAALAIAYCDSED